MDYGLELDHTINNWSSVQLSYIINYQHEAKYFSEHKDANRWLGNNTHSLAHHIKARAELSTVSLYKLGKFIAPGSISVAYQSMIEGRNTPKVNRLELEYRMFF